MSEKQYIGSQQHWEDSINDDYDERERRDKEQEDDREQDYQSDPATPESTANWQKIGNKDKWLNEVRGRDEEDWLAVYSKLRETKNLTDSINELVQKVIVNERVIPQNGFLIQNGDEVNSILTAIMRNLNLEQKIVLRDKLIRRTPERKDNVQVFCAVCGGSITETGTAYDGKPVHIGCYYKANNEMENIPADFKQVTGHDSPKEMAAYEKGREDEQQVIADWIEKWDGSSNSVMGALLKKKFDERKDNVGVSDAIEFAIYTNDKAWFDEDTGLWNLHDEEADPFRLTSGEMYQQFKLYSQPQQKEVDEEITAPSFEECPKCHHSLCICEIKGTI